jgi:hypothetical protein
MRQPRLPCTHLGDDKIKDVLIERSSGDLRASATIEDTAEQFPQAREVFEKYPDLGAALDLEGNYAGFGVHSVLDLSLAPDRSHKCGDLRARRQG